MYTAGFDADHNTSWLANAYPPIREVRGSLEAVIFHNPTHVIIAFQGTELEAGDIWTDLDIRKARLSGIPGRWHQGFARGAGKFWVYLLLWLKHHLGDRKLIITGFSLGAALAQALSVYLNQAHYPHTVYAFGGPRICNRRAAAWLSEQKAKHYRLTVGRDWIAHLPPFFFGYKHVGRHIRLGGTDGHDRLAYLLLVLQRSL
jgi:predicted lipase